MTKNYYDILGINKNSTDAEIKKAYRKQAMQWHPDKNKGDKKAEAKFKEINEAYQAIGDPQKRKQYDTFGSAGNNFGGSDGFSGAGFEDIFKNAGGSRTYTSQNFDFNDIFSEMFNGTKKKSSGFDSNFSQPPPKKEVKPVLDVEKTYEVPIMDLILGTKLNIETVYRENLKLTIPEGTKSGTKFKIKGKGRTSEGKTGDMLVIVDAKMPKNIPEDVKKLLESIKYRL